MSETRFSPTRRLPQSITPELRPGGTHGNVWGCRNQVPHIETPTDADAWSLSALKPLLGVRGRLTTPSASAWHWKIGILDTKTLNWTRPLLGRTGHALPDGFDGRLERQAVSSLGDYRRQADLQYVPVCC
jgi:hypothetical protein